MKNKYSNSAYTCHPSSIPIKEECKAPCNRMSSLDLEQFSQPQLTCSAWAVVQGTWRQAGRLTWYARFQHHCWIKDRHSKGAEFGEVICLQNARGGFTQKYLREIHLWNAFSSLSARFPAKHARIKLPLPAAWLVSLFHLPAWIPKLYRHVEALVPFWRREEREPAESAS